MKVKDVIIVTAPIITCCIEVKFRKNKISRLYSVPIRLLLLSVAFTVLVRRTERTSMAHDIALQKTSTLLAASVCSAKRKKQPNSEWKLGGGKPKFSVLLVIAFLSALKCRTGCRSSYLMPLDTLTMLGPSALFYVKSKNVDTSTATSRRREVVPPLCSLHAVTPEKWPQLLLKCSKL